MSKKIIAKVHGKHYTYNVVENSGVWSTKYDVYKDDKYLCTYKYRSDAVARAHKEAGPGAYES